MNSDRHEKIVELFETLIQLAPDQRSTFLDEHCRDSPEMRQELEALLDHHRKDDSFLEVRGADSKTSETRDIASSHPKRIGLFKILSVIGEGGMGVVFLAEQEKPVHRRVALKLIKPGMDSKAVIARFESELQALAMMDHPRIAKVFEAGTSEGGRPYFVMEYIPGIPITDYCDQNEVSLEERLRLFQKICDAVQYAHQKAIIHRDLKPSNILVMKHGEETVPKIIDFGLAKSLGHQLTEQSLLTEQGMLLGTPEYMSPEQADPATLDVDTRSDIYSLGVILYRLLTGSIPVDISEFRRVANFAALESIRRKICEEEPQKPSTRVGSDVEKAGPRKSTKHPDRKTLTRRLRGDLDWIVMKSLEKNRARRYSTASDLSADIERHLNHEPVLAGPPSRIYLLKKLVRKNARAVASILMVFVLLLAGGATSTVFYFRSEEKRVEAEEATGRERRQRRRAEAAERDAVDKRTEAQAARRESDRQRDEVLRLSDIKRLQQLVDEAERLWPAHPDHVGAMEAWRREAHQLSENLTNHEDSLNEIKELAIEQPDETAGNKTEWKFRDLTTQWRHDVLSELVTGLRSFTNPKSGTIANIDERIQFATSVKAETVEKYDVEWQEAIASIANKKESPSYNGLVLKTQIGLVPVGKDPRSGLWEFGQLQTGSIPERDENGNLILSGEMGIVFVLIPGGSFLMGAQREDPRKPNFDANAQDIEGPVHEVHLDAFFLSKYEMTQGQWRRFVGKNPSFYSSHNYNSNWDRTRYGTAWENVPTGKRNDVMDLHPVEQVSWLDGANVMGYLNLKLPTEAQWEFAARAGTNTVFWTGNEVASLQDAANLADSFAKSHGGSGSWQYEKDLDDGFTVHAPVGSLKPNGFGIHDLHGNVFEWCRDEYGSYADIKVKDGDGERLAPGIRFRMWRGGCFAHSAVDARISQRSLITPDNRGNLRGIRPAAKITD